MSTMVPAYGGAVMVSSSVHRRSAVSTAMAAQRVCTHPHQPAMMGGALLHSTVLHSRGQYCDTYVCTWWSHNVTGVLRSLVGKQACIRLHLAGSQQHN